MKSRYQTFYKRTLTLMELMVVIVIIGLVSSVVAYNVRGSLNRGRLFKTEQAMNMLDDFISLEVTPDKIHDFIKDPKTVLKETGLAKDVDKLLTDGWGSKFVIKEEKGAKVRIRSINLKAEKDRIVELSNSPSKS